MIRRLLPKPVANTGSQLRDHQANERTFLSWTRMGLAFAAMALALGRLDMIDHIFSTWNSQAAERSADLRQPGSKTTGPVTGGEQTQTPKQQHESGSQPRRSNDLIASRMCQAISVWCFGYGISRYVSVRRNLLQGRFIPAIWGPMFMTCGTLGTLGALIEMDWRRPRFPMGQGRNGS
ncbi:hypothetical protein PHISP_00933 [Aspergillus sp. HF37]|nr:hypothetical protein PHISP_00933 [Aspergillus sp. HF37]